MGNKKKKKKSKKKNGIKYVLVFFGIVVFLMISVGLRRLELQYHYETTSATVIAYKSTSSKSTFRNSIPYSTVVMYEFYVDGTRYTGSHNISGKNYIDGMPIESVSMTQLPVRYSRFFPSINEVYFGIDPIE